MTSEVYIISGCRTPIGSFQGQFEKYSAAELGSIAISEAVSRASLQPSDVDQVIMGHVLTGGQGQNPARQAAIAAKFPNSKPAFSVNMLCGSGLKAVCLGYQAIKNADCKIVVAGGQESMTRAHHSAYLRGGVKFGTVNYVDNMLLDGLTDAFENIHMGNTAEHLAKEYNVARETQDRFAFESQTKTGVAISSGYFDKEIVKVIDKRSGNVIDKDEFPRPDVTLDKLAKLRPCFDKNGTVTAGNASGINDGAAALVLCSGDELKSKLLTPIARIVAFAEVGVEPIKMGLGPIEAVNKVLEKAKWSKDDVDLFELNEAFAVQSVIVVETLKVDPAKVNVTGGAIALGHPIGASGARVLVTLLHNLQRLKKKKGIAALCIGGGMGIAIAVECCN